MWGDRDSLRWSPPVPTWGMGTEDVPKGLGIMMAKLDSTRLYILLHSLQGYNLPVVAHHGYGFLGRDLAPLQRIQEAALGLLFGVGLAAEVGLPYRHFPLACQSVRR